MPNGITKEVIIRVLVYLIIIILTLIITFALGPQIERVDYEIQMETYDVKSVNVILLKNIGYLTADDIKVVIQTDFEQRFNEMKPAGLCSNKKSGDLKEITYKCDKLAGGAEFMITVPSPKDPKKVLKTVIYEGKQIKEQDISFLNIARNGIFFSILIGIFIFLAVIILYKYVPKDKEIKKEQTGTEQNHVEK